jgi:hypothetical protein
MKWFKLTIPPTKIASDELLNLFAELFIAGGESRNTALFSSDSSPDTFYICASEHSLPYITLLIDSYSASSCHKPSGEKLNLLSGEAEHIDKLLQDTDT